MTSKMQTVLLIGATSGLGEALAKALHGEGKKLIITGRRNERLEALKKEMSGIDTIQWDITDLSEIPKKVSSITSQYTSLDTVIVNSGVMQTFSMLTPPESDPSISISNEITTNITAPITIAHHFFPHLASIAAKGQQAVFAVTTSGLAYTPMGLWPVYCPTKAGLHAFCVGVRQTIQQSPDANVKKNLNVVEIVPPYVEGTELGAETRHRLAEMLKNAEALSVEQWVKETMEGLASHDENGKMMKEVAAGSAKQRVKVWRDGPGQAFVQMGMDC